MIFPHSELGLPLLQYLFLQIGFVLHNMGYKLDMEWSSKEKFIGYCLYLWKKYNCKSTRRINVHMFN